MVLLFVVSVECSGFPVILVQAIESAYPDIALQVFAEPVHEAGTDACWILFVMYKVSYLLACYPIRSLTSACCNPVTAVAVSEDIHNVSLRNESVQLFLGSKHTLVKERIG